MRIQLHGKRSFAGIVLAMAILCLGWVTFQLVTEHPFKEAYSVLYSNYESHWQSLNIRDMSFGITRQVTTIKDGQIERIIGVDAQGYAFLLVSNIDGWSVRKVDLSDGQIVSYSAVPPPVRYGYIALLPSGWCTVVADDGFRVVTRIPGLRVQSADISVPANMQVYGVEQAAVSSDGTLAIVAHTVHPASTRVFLIQKGELLGFGVPASSVSWSRDNKGDVLSVMSTRNYAEYRVIRDSVTPIRQVRLHIPFIRWFKHSGMLGYCYPTNHVNAPDSSGLVLFSAARQLTTAEPILAVRVSGHSASEVKFTNIETRKDLWTILPNSVISGMRRLGPASSTSYKRK